MKPTIQKNVIIDSLLIVIGILVIISGFQLVINYHAHRLAKYSLVWGFNYYNWYDIHLISSIGFVTLVIIHVILHFSWYKSLFKGNLAKYRPTLIITLLFLFTTLTSFVPFLIKHLSKTRGDLPDFVFLMIELHDKMGIIFTILIILHVIRRKDRLGKMFTKLFN